MEIGITTEVNLVKLIEEGYQCSKCDGGIMVLISHIWLSEEIGGNYLWRCKSAGCPFAQHWQNCPAPNERKVN